MAIKDERLLEELHIDDGDFERVRHIWRGYENFALCGRPPVGAVAYCGAVKVRPAVNRRKAATDPDLCVVCGVLRGHVRV